MPKIAAVLLVITGDAAAVVGVVLFWVLRASGEWGNRASRVMWRGMADIDSSLLRTALARKAMADLGKENPRLAAELADNLRQFDELEHPERDDHDARQDESQNTRIPRLRPALL
jgi:hypothetical protein